MQDDEVPYMAQTYIPHQGRPLIQTAVYFFDVYLSILRRCSGRAIHPFIY